MAVYYVVCDDDCRYEGMTKEQILTAIEQAISQGHISDPDSAVFSKIKEIRANEAVQFWKGTEAEFNALSPAPSVGKAVVRVSADGVLYLCNDDTTFDLLNEIAESGLPIEMGGTKAKTAEEARKNLDVPSNAEMHQRDRVVNLLDNSDFANPVNQRGQTSYANGTGYCIDRWKQATGGGTVSVVDGGVELTGNSTRCWMYQPLAKQLVVGNKYTLYVELADGRKHAGVLTAATSNDSLWDFDGTGVIPTLSCNDFAILVEPGYSVTVKYAALYEGEYTTENVPAYQPKGYAQELAECQRYCWEFPDDYRCYGYGDTYGSLNVDIILPVEMRVNPTVTHTLSDLTKGNDSIKDSVIRVDITATTKKVRFGIVTLNANLANQLMAATLKNIKLNAEP